MSIWNITDSNFTVYPDLCQTLFDRSLVEEIFMQIVILHFVVYFLSLMQFVFLIKFIGNDFYSNISVFNMIFRYCISILYNYFFLNFS
jgi:hypothetical protein